MTWQRQNLTVAAQILTAAQQMMSFNKPSESEYQSVGRYLDNRQALGEKEATWIQHKEDIITLRTGRDGGWLDDMVEGFLKLCHCSLVDWVFRSKVSSTHLTVLSKTAHTSLDKR